uniref:OBP13 n=1 Tax=Sesamia inferens TaxID=492764 RepID=S5TNT5_SESIF|nr:OBP13 [Sesamia inferens]
MLDDTVLDRLRNEIQSSCVIAPPSQIAEIPSQPHRRDTTSYADEGSNDGATNGEGFGYCPQTFKPIEEECLKELGISNNDLEEAIKARDISMMDPCFFGCLFKKVGLLNEKGRYDLNTGLAVLKKLVMNDSKYAKLEESARRCETVNDQEVSDGDAGCERGVLVVTCFFKTAQ